MKLFRNAALRLRAMFNKRKLDAEMDEEMRSHIEMLTRANIQRGMEPEEARFAALRQFGWTESIKEECREQRGVRWLEDLVRDIRFGARQLRKNPGFTAVAALSLSFGIAANTTIFTFINELLIRPAPVEAPHELWQVWFHNPKSRSALEAYSGLSYPAYSYFRAHNQSFVSLAAFDPETPFVSWNRDGVGQSIQCQFVSGDFFSVCGVGMRLGRAFSSDEDRHPGAAPVAVVSERFWRSRLRGDPGIVGQTITLNGVALTVLGVVPARFTGLIAALSPDVWAPFMMAPPVLHDPEWHTRAGAYSLFGVGRLKHGVKTAQAEAELTTLTRQLASVNPDYHEDHVAAVFPTTMVPAPFRGFVGGFTAVLLGAAFMVLLIACVNVANLMLARAVARRREMAVRASIGASRLRLIRQLLTESMLLSLFGGVALLLAVSGLFGVIAYSVSQRTREIGIRMALGAKPGEVLSMVLRQGVGLAGVGILIGLAGAFAATRVIRGLLYGISATDPMTFIATPVLLALVVLLACWLPARRAAKVDPVVALRCE